MNKLRMIDYNILGMMSGEITSEYCLTICTDVPCDILFFMLDINFYNVSLRNGPILYNDTEKAFRPFVHYLGVIY